MMITGVHSCAMFGMEPNNNKLLYFTEKKNECKAPRTVIAP